MIESRDQLAAPMAAGEKPAANWRIGTEHEKQVYRLADFRAPSYDEPGGIRDLLKALERFGWQPIVEGGNVIALKGPDGNVSLEPAGQLELSGAPLPDAAKAVNGRLRFVLPSRIGAVDLVDGIDADLVRSVLAT